MIYCDFTLSARTKSSGSFTSSPQQRSGPHFLGSVPVLVADMRATGVAVHSEWRWKLGVSLSS